MQMYLIFYQQISCSLILYFYFLFANVCRIMCLYVAWLWCHLYVVSLIVFVFFYTQIIFNTVLKKYRGLVERWLALLTMAQSADVDSCVCKDSVHYDNSHQTCSLDEWRDTHRRNDMRGKSCNDSVINKRWEYSFPRNFNELTSTICN